MIRAFVETDWELVWPIFRAVVDAGDTYAYDPDWSSDDARRTWVEPPPAHTVVSVEGSAMLGTAKMGPNRPGRGSHVARARRLGRLSQVTRTVLSCGRDDETMRALQPGLRALEPPPPLSILSAAGLA